MSNIPGDQNKTQYQDDQPAQQAPEAEPVWTFRGYRLKPSEFTTAMVHFFRAEISRANVWRTRLDATTNWAVVTTGVAISIAFNQSGYHGVILLNTLLITLFLYIEARRYRYYELWSYRVRLMETDFYAPMLVPPFHPASDWAESLAENLLHPQFPISIWEAFGRRFRRNYMWIYFLLGVSWFAKIGLMPPAARTYADFVNKASIGNIPGQYVILAGIIFNAALFVVGVLTSGLQRASGEVLPRYFDDIKVVTPGEGEATIPKGQRPWYRFSRRRQQLMAQIITDQAEMVSQRILQDMQRGVTALHGTGMYSGKSHDLLLCALTVTEVNLLKTIVREADPRAFVVVSPVKEILGRGFTPLAKEDEENIGKMEPND